MAFDPIVAAIEGGGYISLIKMVPPLIVLAVWGRMLTWADKDAVDAHLPRIGLNVGFLCGLVLAFALFLFLPTFLIAFAALVFVMVVEVATYLVLRHQKVGLQDLKEQFAAWRKSKGGKKKTTEEVANQVTLLGKGGAALAPPPSEDPSRPAY